MIIDWLRKRNHTQTYDKLLGFVPVSIKESQQWANCNINKSLDYLVKRLIKENKKNKFMKILELRRRTNGVNDGTEENGGDDKCVIIKNPSEVETLVDEGFTHVLSVRVFTHHLIRGPHQLKPSEKCHNGFRATDKEYCINPYHYEMKDYDGTGVELVKNSLKVEKRVFERDDESAPIYTLTPDSIAVKDDEKLIDLGVRLIKADGTVYANTAVGDFVCESLDDTLKKDSDQHGHDLAEIKVRLNEPQSPWMSITYREHNDSVQNNIRVEEREFVVKSGSEGELTENEFVIEARSSPFSSNMERYRSYIGEGIKFYHTDGKVFIENRCNEDRPLYVISCLANRMNDKRAGAVMKVTSKMTFKLWDDAEFAMLLFKNRVSNEDLDRLKKYGKIQIGFYKQDIDRDRFHSIKTGPPEGCYLLINLPHVEEVVTKADNTLCGVTDT